MSKITICVGDRLRRRRIDLEYTQEHLAELADVHPTYLGQVERGDQNIPLESLEKICLALDLPLAELFYNIHTSYAQNQEAIACYDLIVRLPLKDQKQLCLIIYNILQFRS